MMLSPSSKFVLTAKDPPFVTYLTQCIACGAAQNSSENKQQQTNKQLRKRWKICRENGMGGGEVEVPFLAFVLLSNTIIVASLLVRRASIRFGRYSMVNAIR